MTMRCLTKRLFILVPIAFLILTYTTAEAQKVKGSFVYALSNFTGTIPYDWVRISVDKESGEVYVINENYLRVFNQYGMEIYRFGDDLDLGSILDIAVDQNGNILLLTYKEPNSSIIRCNYRGEPKDRIELKNLPPEFSGFIPNRMVYQGGNLYLASLGGMKIVIADAKGSFRQGYDLIPLVGLKEKNRADTEISGLSVDQDGNILFTIPVLFRAFILSPDGKIDWFGKPGGAPGKFNIAASVVRDSKGNFLVLDKLKCAVMAYDKDYNFLTQFGSRGLKPGNLIAPDSIVIDSSDRIYVTQGRSRGVSIFRLIYN
jgi:hypothetical protein